MMKKVPFFFLELNEIPNEGGLFSMNFVRFFSFNE